MNADILVSVIMCIYNTKEEYLIKAVQSILEQTYQNLELLIVDDASDSDLFTADLFSDKRIKIIRLPKNEGPGAARNKALAVAKGKYIAIMDSDDISYPKRLQVQVEYMEEHRDVVACGSFFKYFGEKDYEVKRVIDDNEYYRCCLLFGNVPTLLNPSVILRHSTLKDNKIVYDTALIKAEDYKMWVQLSRIGICTNIKQTLLKYRVHGSQISTALRTKDVSDYDFAVMKEQYENMGIALSDSETAMLKKDYKSPAVSPIEYKKWLQKLLAANKNCMLYDQAKLEKRVAAQWESKVLNIKSIKELKALLKNLSKEEKQTVYKIELKRIKNIFKKPKNGEITVYE